MFAAHSAVGEEHAGDGVVEGAEGAGVAPTPVDGQRPVEVGAARQGPHQVGGLPLGHPERPGLGQQPDELPDVGEALRLVLLQQRGDLRIADRRGPHHLVERAHPPEGVAGGLRHHVEPPALVGFRPHAIDELRPDHGAPLGDTGGGRLHDRVQELALGAEHRVHRLG